MQWTIPTLVQVLVDQGITPARAGAIVAATYPTTRGDTFYRKQIGPRPETSAVGVYAIHNDLRANQAPLEGVKASDDARTIAQFGRLNGWKLEELVDMSGPTDAAIQTVVDRTVSAILQGDTFEPALVEPNNPLEDIPGSVARLIAKSDGMWDSLSSKQIPRLGG